MQPGKETKELSAHAGAHHEDELLDLKQAAALLKMKPETIYTWVHQRRIPYRKHGTRLVFSKRELLAWSEAQAVRPLDLPGLKVGPEADTRRNDFPSASESGAKEDCSFKIRRIVPSGLTSRKEDYD